jgi:hypothetical protein
MDSDAGPETIEDSDDKELIAAAAQVRDYVVTLRGGAPFLSPADSRLLIRWLDDGRSVGAILAAVDRVVARRAARSVRTRLSLSACAAELSRLTSPAAPPGPAPTPDQEASRRWRRALEELGGEGELAEAQRALLDEVDRWMGSPAEERVPPVISAIRLFLEQAWLSRPEEQARLRHAAAEELAPLGAVLSPALLADLVEEKARAYMRGRWPQLQADAVWAALGEADQGAEMRKTVPEPKSAT